MKFDLYGMCEEKQDKGSLRVVLNEELKKKTNLSLIKLKEKGIKLNHFAKEIGIDYTTLWKNLNNDKVIPLIILKKLEEMTSTSLQDHITYLYSSHLKCDIKIPKRLSESLSKLIGCVIADGHLKTRKARRGKHYELVIREGHKSNIKAVVEWVEEVFKITPKINKKDNHYFIYISNKIIHNYFTKIVGLPEGKKAEIVNTPPFIFNSSIAIKKAYLQGLFMFDGGVDYRTAYIDYISKSKKLVEEITNMLKEINLEPDYVSLKPDRYERYKIRFRKREKLGRCLDLFQKNSEKWWRLYEHLYGLEDDAKDLKTLLKSLDTNYPRVRTSAMTFSDIIKGIESLRENANMLTLSKKLKRKKTVVYEFLKKLEYWKIIKSYRIGLRKHYKINTTLKIPRRSKNGRKDG